LMRTYFVIACADCYTSISNRANIHTFIRYEVAVWVTVCVPFFWLVLSILLIMWRTLENGKCDLKNSLHTVIMSTYVLAVVGVISLFSMIIFALLMLKILKNIRTLVQSITNSGPSLHRLLTRDRELMKMLFIDLIIYIITTISNTAIHIYKSAVNDVENSWERQNIERFFVYIARAFLLYISSTFSFWVYVSTLRSNNPEWKTRIIKCYQFIIWKWKTLMKIL